ncbi:MAPEG family protein [Parasphingopyxis sp.]|uniref:MAPEG family protein n=1 Tax=Parasphingopyxis sp. TaxID=1920299 RepID=UPI00261DEAB9|nr:MAPEG family protein [Parasphingopyxis sp.]
MNSAILAPAAVLICWTLFMLIWLAATRFPAIKKTGLDIGAQRGGRGQDLEGVLPPEVQWKAHNYAHLVEQPTLFYAVVFIIALTGTGDAWINVWLAWAYVGIRIVHSIWQSTVNIVPVRFLIFSLGSLVLLALALHATAAALQ